MTKNFLLLLLALFLAACAAKSQVLPGTLEDASGDPAAPEQRARELAAQLDIADDQFAIFYSRPQQNYAERAIWLWRIPGGDGGKNFPYTQDFQVQDGLGYMIFAQDGSDLGEQPILGPEGQFGFIVRNKDSWDEQTADLSWSVSQDGNLVLYVEGAEQPVSLAIAASESQPHFSAVRLQDRQTLQVRLSRRYGLELQPGSSGFSVQQNGAELPLRDAQNCASPERSQNFADCVILTLEQPLQQIGPLALSHPSYRSPVAVRTIGLAGELAATPPLDTQLGAIYSKEATEFRLWAPFASKVELLLYRESYAVAPAAPAAQVLALNSQPASGVWSAGLDGDWHGWFYEYRLQNPDGWQTVLDPYARSMDAYLNQGGPGRAAVVDLARTQPPAGWEGLEDIHLAQREDAIIYEANVRDFTISPDSGVRQRRGSFLAFIQKIPYLKELGITHVQLMPVYNFYYTNETQTAYEDSGATQNSNYNWGYDPHNWFAPEGWYASNAADPALRIRELKTLVKELHRAGIGVLVDVVFNHAGQTSFYEDIVPGYYFRRQADGSFASNSGVGNDIASSRTMVRKLIDDAIYYWAKEFRVDGFRFDLMGLLDTQTVLAAYQRVRQLPGKADILFEGEGWKMYNGAEGTVGMDQDFMRQTDEVAVFNDELRDLLKAGGFHEEGRGFVTGKAVAKQALFDNLLGRPQQNYRADDPGDSMVYTSAHDGLTLHDTIAHNLGLDPVADRREIAQRAKLANLLLLTSQSIPFLHSGQERGRSKPNISGSQRETIGAYVRNSYDSADNINQLVWTLAPEYQQLLEYTKGLIALRKAHPAFRLGSAAAVEKAARLLPQAGDFHFAYRLEYADKTYYILVNAGLESGLFVLDQPADFQVLAGPYRASSIPLKNYRGLEVDGAEVRLDALGAAILLAQGK